MDIDKLRKEIDGKKKNLDERKGILGETIVKKQTGDQFLKELMHTRQTGTATTASIKVKTVDRAADGKRGGKMQILPVDPNLLQHVASPTTHSPTTQQNGGSAAMNARMEEAKRIREEANNPNKYNQQTYNGGVADSISKYLNIPLVGAPMSNGMLTEQQMMEQYARNGGGQSAPNGFINEQVTNVARELLNENFGKLYAEAMKNSIIEAYKAEVVGQAIKENRSLIEQIVRDYIKELQGKAQSGK